MFDSRSPSRFDRLHRYVAKTVADVIRGVLRERRMSLRKVRPGLLLQQGLLQRNGRRKLPGNGSLRRTLAVQEVRTNEAVGQADDVLP